MGRNSDMPRSWEIFFTCLILRKYWSKKYTKDWRLGQLFENLKIKHGDLFYIEDDKLLELIKEEKYE